MVRGEGGRVLSSPEVGVLFEDLDMTDVEEHRAAGGSAVVFTAAWADRDGPNEDSAALFPVDDHSAVLAVADGVGGHPGGHAASSIALRELGRAIEKAVASGTRLRNAVLTGIENANRAVHELVAGAATTLAIAKLEERQLRAFHVGDSLVAVVGQRGKRKLETVSHSPVGYAVEAGVLDEREALHHEDRHVISNAVGTVDMRIEIGPPVRIAARDTVLLATDGLLDNLFLDEILDVVRAGPLLPATRWLAKTCRARMKGQAGKPCKPDDFTFIAWRRDARPRRRRQDVAARD